MKQVTDDKLEEYSSDNEVEDKSEDMSESSVESVECHCLVTGDKKYYCVVMENVFADDAKIPERIPEVFTFDESINIARLKLDRLCSNLNDTLIDLIDGIESKEPTRIYGYNKIQDLIKRYKPRSKSLRTVVKDDPKRNMKFIYLEADDVIGFFGRDYRNILIWQLKICEYDPSMYDLGLYKDLNITMNIRKDK